MSGRRTRQAPVPYNPGVDGMNDKERQQQELDRVRSKRRSLKPLERFNPAREGRSATETKRARGETPAASRQAEEQKVLGDRTEARFTEQFTGAFHVIGPPYWLAKDPRSGVCRYTMIEDVENGIRVGIGSFVEVLVPPDYDNDQREQQFATTDPWIEYIAFLEAVEIEPQGEPKCHLRWLLDVTELPEEAGTSRPLSAKWVTIVNDSGNALSTDVPLLWVQGPVYVKDHIHCIHKQGSLIDFVRCTECLLNGLAGLVTSLPDSDGHCHEVASIECPKPEPGMISVSECINYKEKKIQSLSNIPFFTVQESKRTLAYVTLEECNEQKPLEVPLPFGNSPNVTINVTSFPVNRAESLQVKVGITQRIEGMENGGRKTSKLAHVKGYANGVATCREMLPAAEAEVRAVQWDKG